MSAPDQDPVEDALRAWQPTVAPDPHLARHVLNRIALEDEGAGDLVPRGSRPPRIVGVLAATLAVACVLLVFALLSRESGPTDGEPETLARYRLAIDPLARLEFADPSLAVEPSLVEMLRWMEERFALAPSQWVALAELDKAYGPEFERLYRELVAFEQTFGRFEALRFETDRIDFVALYDALQERRETAREATAVSSGFIEAVLAVLNPTQQERYLALVNAPRRENDA